MKCHVCSYYVICTTVVSFVVGFVMRASGEEHQVRSIDPREETKRWAEPC